MGGSAAVRTRDFVQEVARGVPEAAFEARLWDGTSFDSVPGLPPRFRLHLRRPDALRHMLTWPVDRSICEAYFHDYYDLEGDLGEVFQVAEALARDGMKGRRRAVIRRFFALPGRNGKRPQTDSANHIGRRRTRKGDQSAIAFHYDVSNAFYQKWLGRDMVYSGAYFTESNQPLGEAQRAKLDHICKALRLKPGDRLLDIGCGWGALSMHAAEEFGAQVLGVTIAEEQASHAQAEIARRGLDERCRVEMLDYRDVNGTFDAIASIEMLHHVAEKDVPAYFARTSQLLAPGGRSLHLAVTAAPGLRKMPRFAREYFMPDVALVPMNAYVRYAEEARFEVLSVRGLRDQYRLTAEAWLARMEAAHQEIVEEVGEVRYRIWRLSIALMAHAFRNHSLRFHHLVLQRRGGSVDLALPVE